jgi:hypothetical protein
MHSDVSEAPTPINQRALNMFREKANRSSGKSKLVTVDPVLLWLYVINETAEK